MNTSYIFYTKIHLLQIVINSQNDRCPVFFSSTLSQNIFFFPKGEFVCSFLKPDNSYFADVREAIGVSKDGLGDDKIGMSDRCIIIYHNSKNDDDSQCKIYYNNIRMILL